LTIHGEWWRLGTSLFVHINLIHLLLNLWVLNDLGGLVERWVGAVGFLLVYIISGLVGSLVSVAWYSDPVVSAGASGAVFGVCGALGALLVGQPAGVSRDLLRRYRSSLGGFVLYNVAFNILASDFVDVAAHLGGAAAGAIGGFILRQPVAPAGPGRRAGRNRLLAALGAGAVIVGALLVADGPDPRAELEAITAAENQVTYRFYVAYQENAAGRLADGALADLLERELLPAWDELSQRLQALCARARYPEQRHATSVLCDYAAQVGASWRALATGIRRGDGPQRAEFERLWEEAQRIADRTRRRGQAR
jgi:rhomboid protease GluP